MGELIGAALGSAGESKSQTFRNFLMEHLCGCSAGDALIDLDLTELFGATRKRVAIASLNGDQASARIKSGSLWRRRHDEDSRVVPSRRSPLWRLPPAT